MNDILTEKQYQKFILDYLKTNNGYIVRKDKNFDRLFACDREMLFKFLNDTQPDEMDSLQKIYKFDLEDTLVSYINSEMTKNRGSLVEVLKHGIEISNIKLNLMYTKPATSFNRDLVAKYEKNIFSVIEEVWASDKERVDVVIFLNGLAIMTFELKCNAAGQSYEDAIYQYRNDRNSKTRLFLFKAGALVNFAMDLEQVYMTTKLAGDSTFFLPFNMGNGEGVQAGAGNPLFEHKYSVSYMWEEILTKDSILELISKFVFVETKEEFNEETGKKKTKETLIFPRFHQRDVLHKILDDVYINGSTQNYLIQHSAGSGKTNSIAWLAYRLSSLHDADDKIIYDNIIIITDRVVVDRQLQAAIMGMEHKSGLIKVMDDKCNSADLAIALNGNTKIIATTIQKFPYIVDEVENLKNKKFAVIIDEAHSSTAGKDMAAVTMTLGAGEVNIDESTAEDLITEEVAKHGKQANVSIFAFTATPKSTTLQLFGRVNTKGQREAFHIYSMKQAIEEGFILDVLQNYTTYKTYFQINKEIAENENTLVLTMAIIAEELKKQGKTCAEIRFGVGLPLTRMGKEKQNYNDYMLRNRRLNFKYEGISYSVYILSVDVFPQGYAGVVSKLNTFGTAAVVVDIGSWTIDILPLIEGQPDLARCKSLAMGTITAMNDINEALRQKFGEEADEAFIKEVMIHGESNINKEYLNVIKDGLYKYVEDIMNSLRSLKFNSTLTHFVFIGGGATIIRNFLKEQDANITIIDDVNINAKGYEEIMRHKYKVG